MPRAAKDTKATKASKTTKAKKPAASTAKAKKPAAKVASAKKPAKKATTTRATAKKPTAPKSTKAAKTVSKAVKTPVKTAKAPSKAKSATAAKKPAARKSTKAKRAGDQFKDFQPYTPKRGEEYMNEQQRAHFKAILLNWKSELMQEVDRTVNHMKDEAANFPDPADRATQEEEFSLELRTRDRERKLIKKIDATIELIDQNDYGYCDACGVEIGIQRLEARPTATQCIDCKTLAEIKEKQEMG
jgi:DnaK suppressor protein